MIVTVKVPVAAVGLAENVTVEEQFGLQPAGENVAVIPRGGPPPPIPKLTVVGEEVSEKGKVTETSAEMLAVLTTVAPLGETEILKSNGATVSAKGADLLAPAPLSATIPKLNVPVAAAEVALNVTVEEQFGLQLAGENVAVIPAGRPPPPIPKLTAVVEEVSEKSKVTETAAETLAV